MTKAWCILAICWAMTVDVKGDYSCVCNYEVDNPVLAQPDDNSTVFNHLYEFDCKPAYEEFSGDRYTAVQIDGKIGYIDSQSNVQSQICPGDPSPLDLLPTTPEQTIPIIVVPTTHRSTTAATTDMSTSDSTTQMPTTTPTTHMPTTSPTTQMPTTSPTTRMPTTSPTTHMPTTSPTTRMPTTSPTTRMPTTSPTTHLPTTSPTTRMPTTSPTTRMPTTSPTTRMPTTSPTTHMPTTSQTTRMPTTSPTTRMPTTSPTTQMPTTSPTTMMPTSIQITHIPKTVPTTTTTSSTTTTLATTTHSYHAMNVSNSVLKYIGIAYNLTNGNPVRGLETSSNMVDPGLLLGNRVFQINEYSNGTSREIEILNYRRSCNTSYSLLHNGKSYQDEMLIWNELTSDHSTELLGNAFIFNTEFNKVRGFTENPGDTAMYEDVMKVCVQQKLRLKDEMADTEPLSITRDFAKDVCDLPVTYDVGEYVDFLEKWGTSIIVEARLGTKELKRVQTTEPDLFKLVQQKDPNLLKHSGSYMNYASSLTLSRLDYSGSKARTSIPTYSNMAVLQSKSGEMVPVGLKLVPITFAFDWKFWGNIIQDFMMRGVCSDSMTQNSIKQIADNVNKTLPQYFAIKNTQSGLNVSPLIDSDLKMPVVWPKGTYGLMKAATGCPSGHVTWHEGWRAQDAKIHFNIHHHFSPGIGNTLAGSFSDRLQTRYCMKTDSVISPYDMDWPSGNYCILKKGNCPTGFSSGSIYWDDADFLNDNEHGGTLPDGRYNSNTKIYYCCRSDGSPYTDITLPIDRSFVLLRYRGTCQAVYGMRMREVYIQWDTADVNNKDEDAGAHPLDDGGKEHKLHFCFYYFNTGGLIG